jgi:hypothetical protein
MHTGFRWVNLKARGQLENQGIDGWIILNECQRNIMGGCEVD